MTAFPAGATAGSTWDRKLIRQRAIAMAEEARALGVHVLLGPVAGALGKIPAAGRNWEGKRRAFLWRWRWIDERGVFLFYFILAD